MIEIGRYVESPLAAGGTEIVAEAPELEAHAGRPWLRACVAGRLGVPPAASAGPSGAALVPEEAWQRHAAAYGVSGTGKTSFLMHVGTAHLEQGASVVLLAPKGEEYDRMLAHAAAMGWPPERTVLLDPRQAWVPPYNFLRGDLPPDLAAGDWLALFERLFSGGVGYRLLNLHAHALFTAGALESGSLAEAVRIVTDDEYRGALLLRPELADPDAPALREAVEFWRREFGRWPRSQRLEAAGPLTNKLSAVLRSRFLRPLLCARRPPFRLADLWRRPTLVLARLDSAALGPDGARLLAGLLAYGLLRTALRAPGPVPVLMMVDELPVLERFVGEPVAEIVAVARSQNLRFLGAAQHTAQLSDGLRAALAGAAVQLAFRLNPADARQAAAVLAAGTEERLARAVLDVERQGRGGPAETAEWPQLVRDHRGRPLRLAGPAWGRFARESLLVPDDAGLLRELAAREGIPRLYVADEAGRPLALSRCVEGLAPDAYRIEGPSLRLVVRFPRPRVVRAERRGEADAIREWTRVLQQLPLRHAALRVLGAPAGVVRIRDVPDPRVAPERLGRFVAASLRATCQSPDEIRETERWRQDEMTRIASGGTAPAGAGRSNAGRCAAAVEEDDGSIR